MCLRFVKYWSHPIRAREGGYILLYTLDGDLAFAPVPDHAASAKIIGRRFFDDEF